MTPDVAPRLAERVAELSVEVRYLSNAVNRLDEDLATLAAGIKKRDDLMISEAGQNRRALYSLAGALLVALIAAVGTMAAAGVFG